MKLLFDQNLSPELVKHLADLFPRSEHVENIGLGRARDGEIAAHAKATGFVVVTKDSDFLAHARAPLSNVELFGSGCRTAALRKFTNCFAVLQFAFAISAMIRIPRC